MDFILEKRGEFRLRYMRSPASDMHLVRRRVLCAQYKMGMSESEEKPWVKTNAPFSFFSSYNVIWSYPLKSARVLALS